MATRVTSTKGSPEAKSRIGGGPGFPGPNGKGPRGNGWHGGEDPEHRSPSIYRVTMWVVLAAIVMTFAALSMVYIYLNVTASDPERPVSMPRMFFISSGIILVSSFSLEHSRRSLKQAEQRASVRWLGLTLALGIVFLVCQLLGWRELAAQGVFFAGHPHSSFFYLFTGVHGVHLIGGIGALFYLLVRMRRTRAPLSVKTEVAAQVVSLYWHTMDGLWIWLFLLLWLWK
jgi:cytochrome c oxidase subunit III